jgi:hypothetical protein
MPYGHIWLSGVLFKYELIRPFDCAVVPFECRLSPLHPGYVMTMCACASERRSERSAIARLDNDTGDSIVMMSCMCEHQRPAKVSLSHTDRSCSWLPVAVDLKLTSGANMGPAAAEGGLMKEDQHRQNRRRGLDDD